VHRNWANGAVWEDGIAPTFYRRQETRARRSSSSESSICSRRPSSASLLLSPHSDDPTGSSGGTRGGIGGPRVRLQLRRARPSGISECPKLEQQQSQRDAAGSRKDYLGADGYGGEM